MADPLAQFTMLGSGFNSQHTPNPNTAGASQQQQPPDSMQPIGGLPNPEHSRMWMQIQQQLNQQRTTSAGDIVGSQVTLNPFFVPPSFSLSFLLPPSFPLPVSHPSIPGLLPLLYFVFYPLDTALRPALAFNSLWSAYVSSGFLLPLLFCLSPCQTVPRTTD